MALDFEGGLRRGHWLGLIAQISAGSVVVSGIVSGIGVALFLRDDWPDALIGTYEWHGLDVLLVIDFALVFISYFAVGAWIYRAHANLLLTDAPQTEYTPGWALGWFAVPIANFFKPFQAMKALWLASHGQPAQTDETAPGLLWFWWLAWITSSVGGYRDEIGTFDIVICVSTAFSAACLIAIIRQINAAQPDMSIASTFE